MEEFAAKLGVFNPDLVVVGGLQMMDNFPFESGMVKVECSGDSAFANIVIVVICMDRVALIR